jgi:hypothetical protein
MIDISIDLAVTSRRIGLLFHPMPCACDCRTKLETVSAFQPLLRIELAELSQSPAAKAGHEPLKVRSRKTEQLGLQTRKP